MERLYAANQSKRSPRAPAGYRAFANRGHHNVSQGRIEVPALVSLLELPRRRRILEAGCGRGVALPPLAALCEPSRLAGLDIDLALAPSRTALLWSRRVIRPAESPRSHLSR